MEQAVWVFIGMLSVIIGVLILAQMIVHTAERNNASALEMSANQMETQCNFVCASERGTLKSTTINMPSESIITVSGNVICLELRNDRICRMCDCELEPRTNPVLNLTGASRMFISHPYKCYFHRIPPVEVYCMG